MNYWIKMSRWDWLLSAVLEEPTYRPTNWPTNRPTNLPTDFPTDQLTWAPIFARKGTKNASLGNCPSPFLYHDIDYSSIIRKKVSSSPFLPFLAEAQKLNIHLSYGGNFIKSVYSTPLLLCRARPTDRTQIRGEEGPEVLAAPSTAYMAQAIFSLPVGVDALGGYNWRHQGDFWIST